MSTIEMIWAARQRISSHIRRTPIMSSPFLDELAGRRVYIKPECLQHTGSFKYRGARSALSALDPRIRKKGVLAYSSGNHAQGIALAAREFGVPAVIVMPADAPVPKVENTRSHGAEVLLYDRVGGESREKIGNRLQAELGLSLIRPFDEPLVIAGQGTTGLEIAEQIAAERIETADVLVCCGGGGLTSGIALALEAEAPGLRARPCEPVGFDDVRRSLESGTITANEQFSGSICDAIVTISPGQITFPIMKRLCGPGLVASEDECLYAMAQAFRHLKLVAEPGGAAALAAALFRQDEIEGEAVICLITGGNVEAEMFRSALEKHGI
ncbi:MAG: threonine/serine dehydratase [Roseovarius sp.]|nr:threonine/serine dehydratase [Roseovarius sp.]